MRSYKNCCALLILFCICFTGFARPGNDSLGLPGDNLDLYGVMELFKKSSSPEDFEKALNSENNEVNNLDLNGDNEIDYIKVIDHEDNGAHALILQVSVNENEVQDVAVVEVEKKTNGEAHVQIVGDEDFYGKDYIIEPANDVQKAPESTDKTVVFVNVWAWQSVSYIYAHHYALWVSPWRWKHYPLWWKPWRPVFWSVHYNRVIRYHVFHQRVYIHRVNAAHAIYYQHREFSKTLAAKREPLKVKQNDPQGRKTQKQQNNNPRKAMKPKTKNGGRQNNKGGKRAGGKRK